MNIDDTTIAEDKQVDIYQLHLEDQIQPSLVEKWGRKHAESKRRRRELERKVELTFADLINEIRQDPEGYGLDKKPTETSIKNVVLAHKTYCEVFDEYLKSKYEADIFDVAAKTIADKRLTIDGEIKLYLSGYYSQTTRSGEELGQDKFNRDKDALEKDGGSFVRPSRTMRKRKDG